jgi:DNA-binding MarR family transcriptional regulator
MTKSPPISQSLREWMDVFMHRSMHGFTHFAKSTGLSMPQFSILMQLHHKGVCGISDISERFDISSAAASQLVEKLVQGEFVERAEDPSDRRAKVLQLTPKGKDLIEAGSNERYRWMDELAKSLSVSKKGKVIEALTILTKAAKEMKEEER